MITAGGTPLGGDVMDLMPKLGAIVCYGTGYDGVDLAAAAKRKIAVGHSPGANAASVADIAVTLMLAATRRLLPADDYVRGGELVVGKTVADDAAAGRHARPPHRRLRHGRDRPQDRGARRGLRDRGRLFQPQPARRALSIFAEPRGAGGMVQRADDRGARRRRHPSRRRCQDPEKARQGRLCRQHLPRLGDRPAGAGRGADRPDHRRRRSRRVREGAACAGRADRVARTSC